MLGKLLQARRLMNPRLHVLFCLFVARGILHVTAQILLQSFSQLILQPYAREASAELCASIIPCFDVHHLNRWTLPNESLLPAFEPSSSNFFGLPTRRLLRRSPIVTSITSIPKLSSQQRRHRAPGSQKFPQSKLIDSTDKTIVLLMNRMQISFSFQKY